MKSDLFMVAVRPSTIPWLPPPMTIIRSQKLEKYIKILSHKDDGYAAFLWALRRLYMV